MRFGVLGDAKIAREKLYSAITSSGHEVSMIGRRDPSLGAGGEVWQDGLDIHPVVRWLPLGVC